MSAPSFFELDARLKRQLAGQLDVLEEQLTHEGCSLEKPVCHWSRGAQIAHLKGHIDGLRGIFDSPICDLSKDDWFALAERYGAALKAANRLVEDYHAFAF